MEGSAESYEKLRGNLAYSLVESCLNLHISRMEWSEEDIILEIGCGPGRMTKTALLPKFPKFKRMVCIDINSDYIEYARKTYFDERIEYRTQDILEGLDLEEKDTYDKIMSFYVFHYIPDMERLFSVISSILKPGGQFLFLILTTIPTFSIIREMVDDEEWKKFMKTEDVLAAIPPILYWDDVESEFKNFVSKFGLRVSKSKCELLNMTFSDKQHLLDFYLAVLPKVIFKNLQPEIKDRLWKKMERRILERCPQKENGEITCFHEVLHVSGMKTI